MVYLAADKPLTELQGTTWGDRQAREDRGRRRGRGRRVRESNEIAEAAVLQAQRTDGRIGKLPRAAQQIGDVVKPITGIAPSGEMLNSGQAAPHTGPPPSPRTPL